MFKKILVVAIIFSSAVFYAQKIEIKGEVYDEYLVPFYKAQVNANGVKTSTDDNGIFSLKTKLPVTITVSADGYQSESITVKEENEEISLILKASSDLDEIVMSASRTSERLFESPVSVRRLGLSDIKKSTTKDYFSAIGNLPEVIQYNNGSPFQVTNTRGFTFAKNFRVIQLVDGIDNVVPASSASYGNLNGAIDIDVKQVEVLPGASSALYGASAFNGAILIETKNPFEYTGITAKFTGGVTNQKNVGTNGFYGVQARFAYKFSEKFAGSASFSGDIGEEWHANDYRDTNSRTVQNTNTSRSSASYNGLNTYGDEYHNSLKAFQYISFLSTYADLYTKGDFASIQNQIKAVSLTPNEIITRTGYNESDLVENRYRNRKFHTSLYYRPWGDDRLNIIWRSRFNTTEPFLFQGGTDRYEIDVDMQHHALEFRGENFFVRGYYSGTDMNARSIGALAALLQHESKPTTQWFIDYTSKYLSTNYNNDLARQKADQGRLLPGTPAFNSAVNRFNSKILADGGTAIVDFSKFYQADANINLNKYIENWDIILGGSYRNYALQSNGTLFSDTRDNDINFYEYGVYGQVKKNLLDEKRLALMASVRYDNTTNYDGQFSPRISASYTMGEDKNHSIRFTYQTAFRNPSIQDQYYAIQLGNSFTFGNTNDNIERLRGRKYKGIEISDYLVKSGVTADSFAEYYEQSFIQLKDTDGTDDIVPAIKKNDVLIKTYNFQDNKVQPEEVQTFEVGYRGLLNVNNKMFEIDVNGYYNKYTNFILDKTIYIPLSPTADVDAERIIERTNPLEVYKFPYMQAIADISSGNAITLTMPTNEEENEASVGAVISLKTKMFRDFETALSYNYMKLIDANGKKNKYDEHRFNAPNHTIKFNIGHKAILRNLGFNINYKWQSEILWDSPLVKGTIEPQHIVDAQISYEVPSMKSTFKLGGNNLLGKGYYPNLAVGEVGSTYFLSWIVND